jgi:hypothetical protein
MKPRVVRAEAVRWVIVGRHGLYTGQEMARAGMIRRHVGERMRTWAACKRQGDRCIKATISWPDGVLFDAAPELPLPEEGSP